MSLPAGGTSEVEGMTWQAGDGFPASSPPSRGRDGWWMRLAAVPTGEVVPVLTLLILATYSAGSRWLLPLVALGVVLPALRKTGWFWGLATVIIAGHLATTWYEADNHQWLIGYWCFALALAEGRPDTEQQVRASARWLVGGAFGIAVLQKLLRPEFRDGVFWIARFIYDERFRGVLASLFDISAREWGTLYGMLRPAMEGTGEPFSVRSEVPAWMWGAGRLMSFLTIGLEAAVAVSFLAPPPTRAHRVRNTCLATFLVVTYPIAPVTGFGWILTVLALAQLEPRETRAKVVLLLLSVAMPLLLLARSLVF
jgi:hypothetical protein